MNDGLVELLGDSGFSATVDEDDWPVVGARALVRRTNPPQQWAGSILRFGSATRVEFEWFLASGERRQAISFHQRSNGPGPPDVFPIHQGGHEWEAQVVARVPVTAVTVSYRIQSGAERQRVLYTEEAIKSYLAPQSNGSVSVHQLEV